MQQEDRSKSNKITLELLRRRSEHNDGDVSTLKEVTLHQFDIERIENLDIYCRGLEILYLQNNQISRIENLHKLKSLRYLQLALNNIVVLENLEQCESLSKLDLTVNFIEDLLGVECLVNNVFLKELYLVGNPCTQVEGYRDFVVVTLPQLQILDGKFITKSERILGAQQYASIRERLVRERQERAVLAHGQAAALALVDEPPVLLTPEDIERKRREYQEKAVPHTPAARLQAARDLAVMNAPVSKPKAPGADLLPDPRAPKPPPIPLEEGRVLQCNAGKWAYTFTTTPDLLILDVEISKFLDTSFIDVDVHPTYVRVTIKGKLLQLMLPESVAADRVVCERSQYTGSLRVSMLLEARDGDVVDLVARSKQRLGTVVPPPAGRVVPAPRKSRYARLGLEEGELVPDKGVTTTTTPISSRVALPRVEVAGVDYEEDPHVPPLC